MLLHAHVRFTVDPEEGEACHLCRYVGVPYVSIPKPKNS